MQSETLVNCAHFFVGVSAVAHVVFFWKEAIGGKALIRNEKTFGLNEELASKIAPILVNSGAYNLGLAIGLILTFIPGPHCLPGRLYLLAFVILAGIIGFRTLPAKVGIPALIGQSGIGLIALGFVLATM